MKNNKCPCEQCICYAMCKNRYSVILLMEKCELLMDYIRSGSTAKIAIELLTPRHYRSNTIEVAVDLANMMRSIIASGGIL